jgi:hypothetical protein
MRAELLAKGAGVLRALDKFEADGAGFAAAGVATTAEDRVEAAVAARRADALQRVKEPLGMVGEAAAAGGPVKAAQGARAADPVEDLIATRKRARQESAAGFCPGCGKPVQKSDRFCSKCGRTL